MNIQEKINFLDQIPLSKKKSFFYPHYEIGYYINPLEKENIEIIFNDNFPLKFNLPIIEDQKILIKDIYFKLPNNKFKNLDSIRIRNNIQGDRSDDFNIIIASPSRKKNLEDIHVGIYKKEKDTLNLTLKYLEDEHNLIPEFELYKKRIKVFFEKPIIHNKKVLGSYFAVTFDEITNIKISKNQKSYNPQEHFLLSNYIVEFEWFNIDDNIIKEAIRMFRQEIKSFFRIHAKENRKAFHIAGFLTD